jgi:hypothetical protein
MRSTAASSLNPRDISVCNCLESTLPMAASWVTWALGCRTSTTGMARATPFPWMISLQSTCPRAPAARGDDLVVDLGLRVILDRDVAGEDGPKEIG